MKRLQSALFHWILVPFFFFALGKITVHAENAAVNPSVLPPVISPEGSTGFVDSISVTLTRQGGGGGGGGRRIYYTLDNSEPSYINGNEYSKPIIIKTRTTLKAMRYATVGEEISNSATVVAEFIPAKVKSINAKFGLNPHFYPTLLCTLEVGQTDITPKIYFKNGASLPSKWNLYTLGSPIKIESTMTIQAFANYPGYENSDTLRLPFTKLVPPERPQAEPKSRSFSTNTLSVKLKATSGSVIRFTLDPNAKLESWQIGDSLQLNGYQPGDTLVLRAQATKNGIASPILIEKYVYLPSVANPVPSRGVGTFNDTATLFFTSLTKNAKIRYTLDGSPPSDSTSGFNGSIPFQLTTTSLVIARAFKTGQPPSDPVPGTYTLKLTPPDISPASTPFIDSITVHLKSPCPGAKIYFTLDSTRPDLTRPDLSSLIYTPKMMESGLTLSEGKSNVIAIAVKDGIQSSPSQAQTYTKKDIIKSMPSPRIEPGSQEFFDSLSVTLKFDDPKWAADPNAIIRFSTNGEDPLPTSLPYTSPIAIFSTTVIRAQGFSKDGKLDPSLIGQMTFTLLPSMPEVSIKGDEKAFKDEVTVSLSTKTRGGTIFYTLDAPIFNLDSALLYKIGEPISLTKTTLLQAVTVIGLANTRKISNILAQKYEVYSSAPTDTLAEGASRTLPGSFTFTNTSETPIIAKVTTTENWGLSGFKDASIAIRLQTIPAGQGLKVSFTKPNSQNGSLYRIVNGAVHFISAETRGQIPSAGDYFVGIDTQPPLITLLSQNAQPNDSTLLKLSVKDNVLYPKIELQSEGLKGGKWKETVDSTGIISVKLKNAGSTPKSLWFRAKASDFYSSGRLPEDSTLKYYLSQSFSKITTPDVYNIGRQVYRWDLAGLPLSAQTPITWSQVLAANPESDIFAVVLKDTLPYAYEYLNDSSVIRSGMSFWLGSTKPSSTLSLSELKVGESDADGGYRLTLHQGWNQISNPSLDKLYWPITHQETKSKSLPVKGLYAFDPALKDYVKSDSLEPWKGYFVYSYLSKDTVVTLHSQPQKPALAKSTHAWDAQSNRAMATEMVQLELDFGRSIPLILGANLRGQDRFSSEDELQLPALEATASAPVSVWSQRGQHHLATDMLRFVSDSILEWKIIVSNSPAKLLGGMEFERIQVREERLPPGYQAWAISQSRGLKFALVEGSAIAIENLNNDTLTVVIGPASKLSQIPEFTKAQTAIEKFALNLIFHPNGNPVISLALPWNARVEISLWSISGQLVSKIRPVQLSQGFYRLPIEGRNRNQIQFLRAKIHGKDVQRQFSQKLVP